MILYYCNFQMAKMILVCRKKAFLGHSLNNIISCVRGISVLVLGRVEGGQSLRSTRTC
jgi:hypothetical protein